MFLATAESELSRLAIANKNKIKSLSLSMNVEVRRAETRVRFLAGGNQPSLTS